ncbi:MAG: carboxypeptidase M32 [Chloroflexia bacterium]|nr:carboxypeptidase M32 [Chloroflexia bacterium]
MSEATYRTLRERIGETSDIGGVLGLLGWDQQTIMPSKGAEIRGSRMATLTKILDEKFSSDELGALFDELKGYEQSLPFDSDEASIIRVARRDYIENRMVPTDIKVALTKASNEGYGAWVEARGSSNFSKLQPSLDTIVELNKEAIKHVREADDTYDEDYDVLLNGYEPGLKSSEVTRVFDELKAATIPLVERVRERADRVDDSWLHGDFPLDVQERTMLKVLHQLGFTDDAWRLDVTEHPFASSPGIDDIRITTRYHQNFLNPAWFGTMHEFGHGLYEHCVSKSLERTSLARGASMAFHESQSRMWENLIGRGRPFWNWGLPVLKEAYPEKFAGATEDDVYRAVNKLGPSLIRVEADELTYNLHIILRFEIERDLFSGKIQVADLPDVWNANVKKYLGLDVPNDAEGVLQDVHWGLGLMGYFSTYALGNVVSLQLWDRIRKEIPTLDEQTAGGEFAELRDWLRENIHQHGRKYRPTELLNRVVGVDRFDARPLITYLTAKVDDLYGT